MTYTVTITSQGQISIPAPLRKKLGFSSAKKAVVTEQHGKVVVEPLPDLLSLQGSFKTSKKGSSKQIRKQFEEHLAERHTK